MNVRMLDGMLDERNVCKPENLSYETQNFSSNISSNMHKKCSMKCSTGLPQSLLKIANFFKSMTLSFYFALFSTLLLPYPST